MEKNFALKAAVALKKVKSLNAKNEVTAILGGFATLTECCEAGPVIRPEDVKIVALAR